MTVCGPDRLTQNRPFKSLRQGYSSEAKDTPGALSVRVIPRLNSLLLIAYAEPAAPGETHDPQPRLLRDLQSAA